MDALRHGEYKIYFGGEYREQWSDDYSMTVVYDGRAYVVARALPDGGFAPAGGDGELCALLKSPDCPALTREYFTAAARAYAAADDCEARGLSLDRLRECYYEPRSPLAAPELMRLLMDERGCTLELAYQICAHCCADLNAVGVDALELRKLQPRTARVLSLLRQTAESVPSLMFDARSETFKRPFGAVGTGTELSLTLLQLGGRIDGVELYLTDDDAESVTPMTKCGERWEASVPAGDEARARWYCFRVSSAGAFSWLCADATGYIGRLGASRRAPFRLTVYEKGFETPSWFKRSVMYQIFPDRFAFDGSGTARRGVEYHRALGQSAELHESPDEPVRWQPRDGEKSYIPDDFYGGTFKGIEGRLPYLRELGISCLYLNPIVEARSNHRYDASDYLSCDPILGTERDFTELCRAADALGIRVILDGVFSHTGADSIYFNAYGHYGASGACQSRESEYYPWYSFKSWPESYRCWWGFSELPEVDENNSPWQDYVINGRDSVVKTWLRRGASGWRLDVADELPDSVLELIRKSVKAEKPDAPIIGEVWEDAVIKESYGSRRRYALGGSLDSVMNYPLRSAALDFVHRRCDAYALRDFLTGQQMNYPRPMYYALMNLMGSHDVERLKTALCTDMSIKGLPRAEQERLSFSAEQRERAERLEQLCAAIQFALPGVPSIYYGDEQGMEGGCDPFNRLPWREGSRRLHDRYAYLARLRNSSPALSAGEAEFMAENRDVLMILRYVNQPDCRDVRLAVINRSDSVQRYCADCTAAGLGRIEGQIAPESAEIVTPV